MSPIRSLLILLALVPLVLKAQNHLHLKWEPKLAFSADISERWSYNLQAGGLHFMENFSRPTQAQQTERVDARAFLSYSFFRKRKLSVGYMYRKTQPFEENPGYEHRLTALYSFQNYAQAWRLGHRFMAEQRWRSSSNQLRMRYRFSGDVPLQGQKLDVNEFYFLASNEVVLAADSESFSLENRFISLLGRQMSQHIKLEIGAEYRFRGSEAPDALHLLTSLYYKL